MSSYFLLKKSWDATAVALGEDTDAPIRFEEGTSKITAYSALESVYERYLFIKSFISKRDGSCNAQDFELVFLTVCPPDSVDILQLRTRIEEYIAKTKSIKRWFLAYEQRGTVDGDDVGRGRHCHVILDVAAPTSFANLKRGMGNQFRGWIWDARPKLRAWEMDKVEYLKGNKIQAKEGLVEADRLWRVGLTPIIADYYHSPTW